MGFGDLIQDLKRVYETHTKKWERLPFPKDMFSQQLVVDERERLSYPKAWDLIEEPEHWVLRFNYVKADIYYQKESGKQNKQEIKEK